jgi:hypothetical protein
MARRPDPLTPLEAELRRRSRRRWIIFAVVVAVLVGIAYALCQRYALNRPVTYSDPAEHFKYGSIGSDFENGLPLRVLQVLPRMFPEYLPPGAPKDYTAFGFVQEPGHPLPIGFSVRRRVVDLAGLNCAACHVGQVRASAEDAPRVILAMPANTVDLLAFYEFLFACATDNRFTADDFIAEMKKDGDLSFVDRLIYRLAVPQLQAGILKVKSQANEFMFTPHPKFGPGRVDTFNPYKVNEFSREYPPGSIKDAERIGTVDFPAIWNQRPRDGLQLHWDGNNTSLRERNYSAAFGAGATRDNVDGAAMERIIAWLQDMKPPAYPFAITSDKAVLARGEAVYKARCYDCHDFKGSQIGKVDPIELIRTDRYRLDSYTDKLAKLQLAYGDGYAWNFKNFRKTNGYANVPLDGIWARAPYLHNGSVPTMWDLLTPENERNGGRDFFYTGHGVVDQEHLGIRTDIEQEGWRKSFRFVTTEPGNTNRGHSGPRYGTDLSDEDKRALIEYMKTL